MLKCAQSLKSSERVLGLAPRHIQSITNGRTSNRMQRLQQMESHQYTAKMLHDVTNCRYTRLIRPCITRYPECLRWWQTLDPAATPCFYNCAKHMSCQKPLAFNQGVHTHTHTPLARGEISPFMQVSPLCGPCRRRRGKGSRREKKTIARLTDDQKEGRGGREREEKTMARLTD